MAERVATNVRWHRRSRDWTQQQLAEELGKVGRPIVMSGVGKIENGDRRVDVDDLVALSLVFGIRPIDLLSGDPVMEVHGQAVKS